MPRVPLFAILMVLLNLASATAGAKDPPPQESKQTESAGRSDGRIPLHVLSWDETQKLVARQKGKVVVLDVWSSYCTPCIREFPNLVRLHKQYPDDVACMSMNLNYAGLKDEPPESFRKEVGDFLRKQGAEFQNVISSDPDTELFDRLDLASIPAVYVYDRRGKLVKRFDNDQIKGPEDEFTYKKDVIPLVEKLLAENGE